MTGRMWYDIIQLVFVLGNNSPGAETPRQIIIITGGRNHEKSI